MLLLDLVDCLFDLIENDKRMIVCRGLKAGFYFDFGCTVHELIV